MKKIAYFLFLSSLMFLVSCTPKWDPRKYRRVEIVDAGEIYSTFDINKHEKEKKILDKKRWLPDSVLRKITAAASESRWPPAIQTPQLRHDNQKKMKQYKAYLVTSFKNKHILYIPNAENKGANISPELMSDRDFYMIIGKKGVERKEEFMKGYENWTRPPRPKKPTTPVAAAPSRTSANPNAKNTAATPPDKKGAKPTPSADAKTKNKQQKEGTVSSKENKSNSKVAKNKAEKPNAKGEKDKAGVANAKEKEASFEKGKLTGATKKRINSEKGKKKKKKKAKKKQKGKKAAPASTPKTEMLPPKSEKGSETPKAGRE